MSFVFDARDLHVRLGASGQVHALQDVNLQVSPGERVALVGANGSGKSTLLRTLHGLLPLAQGRLDGLAQEHAGMVAMLFQRPFLMRLSALHNIRLGLWLRGVPWRATTTPAREALARVGLSAVAGRNGRSLSGGQQQRLALARAWALKPSVWLLDEPTASLDPNAKREVEALISEFTVAPASPGAAPPTLVFSSHNLGQVKRLASRVVYLEGGRILADLPVHDFFDREILPAVCPAAHAFVKGETP